MLNNEALKAHLVQRDVSCSSIAVFVEAFDVLAVTQLGDNSKHRAVPLGKVADVFLPQTSHTTKVLDKYRHDFIAHDVSILGTAGIEGSNGL